MTELGVAVYVRYRDHVLFRDVNPAAFSAPFIRETIGWLEHDDDHCIRLVWERFAEAGQSGTKQKVTGLVILKSCIQELRYLGKEEVCMHDAHEKEIGPNPHIPGNARSPKEIRAHERNVRPGDKPGPGRGGEA